MGSDAKSVSSVLTSKYIFTCMALAIGLPLMLFTLNQYGATDLRSQLPSSAQISRAAGMGAGGKSQETPKYRGYELTPEEEEIGLDPFKYLPPESELKLAEEQQKALQQFIAKEKTDMKSLTKSILKKIDEEQKTCPASEAKNFISSNCAHNEEKGWQWIGGVNVFFITTECSDNNKQKPWVLFLHGQKYSTQEWVDLNLLRLTAKLHYNTLSIDLPGYAKSDEGALNVDEVAFIQKVADFFKMKRYVIVSPSMSGTYSIPLLKQREPALVGLVAVAPTKTETLTEEDFKSIDIPVLAIVGEKDTDLGATSVDNLSKLKNTQVFKIPDAGHACYLDDKTMFQTKLFQFLMCTIGE